MSSTTLLLESSELQKVALIQKDDHITIYKTCHQGRLYTLTILHGSNKDSISSDAEIARRLDHPNIVKCYEISSRNDGIHVLTEFLTAKSLVGSHVRDESCLSNLTRQILLALSYLHKRGLSHGGITPSRFFMDCTKGLAKIAYFGRILQADHEIPSERIETVGGRFRWDLWCLGVSILELYLGSSGGNSWCKFKQIAIPEVPSTASDEFKDFVSCCLRNHCAEMLTAEQLLQHPFIIRNSITGDHLQGHSLREEAGDHLPFISSPTFVSSSARLSTKETKSSESEVQMAPEHEGPSNGRKNVPEVSDDGKQSIQRFKRSVSDHSILVQRCAKRKRLKAKANATEILPKQLTNVVNENHSSSSKEERTSDNSSAKSEDSVFWQENRMHPRLSADFHYQNLPKNAKSCLLFCSLFPLDYQFDEETLVQLWIAEGLVETEVTERMEDSGRALVHILANEEFIVPSSYDIIHGVQKYKMNESKACLWYTKGGLSSGGYRRIIHDQINDICERSVHLSVAVEDNDSSTIFKILENHKHVRTLLFSPEYGSSIKQIPRSLFISLRNLCTLDLSRTHISELPSTVGCLDSLHYLNLSYTPIKLLPESIDSLYSLQTLKFRSCFALRALPEGISNLRNLRHLDLDIVRQLRSMPKGIGNLANLHTLKAFIVGKDDGHSIGELRSLNHITGSFCISRIENVVSSEEAVKASLSTKRYINKLELRWGSDSTSHEVDILEHLQPHYGLNELRINFYKGSRFPRWMSNPSFDKIVSISIYRCTECQFLPSLGNLPALRFLNMNGLDSVKDLTGLFCRKPNHGSDQAQYAFPKLENLTIENMIQLQELSIGAGENGDFPCLVYVSISYCPQLFDLSLLSHLRMLKNLDISHCNALTSLPEVGFPPSIESLRVKCCPNIRQRYQKNAGQDWSKIAHIPRIWIDYEEISCN